MVCETHSSDPEGFIKELTKYICDKRICIEVCLTSNLGTMPELSIENHAVRSMFQHGVSVTLNTGISMTSCIVTNGPSVFMC